MATKKPPMKKTKATSEKKASKCAKKPTENKPLSKKGDTKKVATKKVATKKIVVKPAKPTAAPAVKKTEKKGLAKPMAKMVVDRMDIPKGRKIFVKAEKRPTAKRPTAKKTVKKTK